MIAPDWSKHRMTIIQSPLAGRGRCPQTGCSLRRERWVGNLTLVRRLNATAVNPNNTATQGLEPYGDIVVTEAFFGLAYGVGAKVENGSG